jgi:biopolymer transport protein ExbD
MSLEFQCPYCGTTVRTPSPLVGGTAICGACGGEMQLDSLSAPVVEGHGEEGEFRSGQGHKRMEAEAEVDMTPLVDVTSLLLIFFMITASVALQRSLAVPKPTDTTPSANARTIEDVENDPDFVTVRVDSFDNYLVLAPGGEEYPIVSKQDLLARLSDLRDANPPPVALMVIAHGDATHERVVAALDCGTAIGIERVMLQTTETDE